MRASTASRPRRHGCLVACAIAVLLVPCAVAQPAATLALQLNDPNDVCLSVGDTLTIDVVMTATSNIVSGSFNLTYDSTVLGLPSSDPNLVLTAVPASVWDTALIGTAGTGLLTNYGVVDLAAPVTGATSGVMAQLHFIVLAEKCSTAGLVGWQTTPAPQLLDTGSNVYQPGDPNYPLTVTALPAVEVDDTAPTITLTPPSSPVPAATGVCNASVSWSGSATDNCTTPPTLYYEIDLNNADPNTFTADVTQATTTYVFPVGTHLVRAVAVDACGNVATQLFTVVVVDLQVPLISPIPPPATGFVKPGDPNCHGPVTWTTPLVVDNCAVAPPAACPAHQVYYNFDYGNNGSVDATNKCPNNSPTVGKTTYDFPPGTHKVITVAKDTSGNTSTYSFLVTVVDNIPPAILTCPGNITVPNDPNVCGAIVNYAIPTFFDECGVVVTLIAGLPPGPFPVGLTTVTWVGTDPSGNATLCTFTVTVNDTQPPTITCPGNITVALDPNVCTKVVTWPAPTVTDNCPGATGSCSPASGSSFGVGTTLVTCTATDASGNTASCTFTVTVTDSQPPVITGCPANITQGNDPNLCSAVVTWTPPTATDNCTVTLTSTHNPGDTFPVGTATVTYTATDGYNTTTCSFTVTVNDTQAPVITGCPGNQTYNTDTDPNYPCQAYVQWPIPAASDNCGVTSFFGNYANGAWYGPGVYNVSIQAQDAAGNLSTPCTFTVTVQDTTNPQIQGCPPPEADPNGVIHVEACGSTAVTWTAPTASDACGVTLTATNNPGDLFSVGQTTVTYTATDTYGNTATCSFIVDVGDTTPPTITYCPPAPPTAYSCNNFNMNWDDAQATDTCGMVNDPNYADPNIYPLGSDTNYNNKGIRYAYDKDNDGPPYVYFKTSNRSVPPGTHRIYVEAKDIYGNVSDPNACTFLITVDNDMDVTVDLQIEGLAGTVTRCTTFELGQTDPNYPLVFYTFNADVTYTIGAATVQLRTLDPNLPCNEHWSCLSVEDAAHSLRSTVPVVPVGDPNATGMFYADLQGNASDWLQQGDLLNDGIINAIDAGLLVLRLGQTPGVNTPCPLVAGVYHADFDGDGAVGLTDFGVYSPQSLGGNYGLAGDAACDPNNPLIRTFVDEFTYADLIAQGVAEVILVDVNRDGYVNHADIVAIAGGTPAWVRGDVNHDRRVDFKDIDALTVALHGEEAYYKAYPDGFWYTADANADGQINFKDIDAFVGLLGQTQR